jgi:hypothetical protein
LSSVVCACVAADKHQIASAEAAIRLVDFRIEIHLFAAREGNSVLNIQNGS